MKIKIRYLARLREAFGASDEILTDARDHLTITDVIALLKARGDVWAKELDDTRAVRVAINYQMVERQASLRDNDELAFFPPVTGG